MTGEQRRTQIRQLLLDARKPMTGTALAKELHVSRQVIVQDIALMRAEQTPILSTNKGYLLAPDALRAAQPKRVFFVRHTTDRVLEEFMTVHPEVSFEKAIFEDADLVLELRPSPESPFDINPDLIARVRMSVSRPPKMGDFKATHEKSVYFDVLYRPTQAFACTKLCRLLKEYLTSF